MKPYGGQLAAYLLTEPQLKKQLHSEDACWIDFEQRIKNDLQHLPYIYLFQMVVLQTLNSYRLMDAMLMMFITSRHVQENPDHQSMNCII